MPSFGNIQEFYQRGKKVEEHFASDFTNEMGGTMRESTPEEDRIYHIDLYWNNDGPREYSFDVKGMRKKDRKDEEFSSETTWVEFVNVLGDPGSLYGVEDYIVFEAPTEWIIVQRGAFAKSCEDAVNDNGIVNVRPDDCFVRYTRKGRQDVIMMVPYSFIKEQATKCIPKSF